MGKKNLTRRGFLKGTLAIGGGLATFGGNLNGLSQLALAQHHPDVPERHYIFCYFGGGWDVLLALDPRDPRDFPSTTISMQRTRIQPAYDEQNENAPDGGPLDIVHLNNGLSVGPYLGDMVNHADKLAIVRGLNMETVSHEAGRRRFITGKAPTGNMARGSSAATWLAGQMGRNELIPNLSVGVESYNKDLPNYATAMRVGSVPDLLRALKPANMIDPRLSRQIAATLGDYADCPNALRSASWQKAEYARAKGADVVAQNVAGQFEFGANSVDMELLRGHYGFNRNNTNGTEAKAALAVQALTTGVSRVVSVNLVGGFDTHNGNAWRQTQGPNQRRGWNAIARMVEDLENRDYGDGSSWLDHTTIVAFSEFSRTPLLNATGGRDHHITNSCLLVGGGIKGGTVIGKSSDVAMGALAIDRHTGLPSPDGEVLNPEHVWRTLFDEVHIDGRPDLRVQGIPALLKA